MIYFSKIERALYTFNDVISCI